jgi:hypothetical protein
MLVKRSVGVLKRTKTSPRISQIATFSSNLSIKNEINENMYLIRLLNTPTLCALIPSTVCCIIEPGALNILLPLFGYATTVTVVVTISGVNLFCNDRFAGTKTGRGCILSYLLCCFIIYCIFMIMILKVDFDVIKKTYKKNPELLNPLIHIKRLLNTEY